MNLSEYAHLAEVTECDYVVQRVSHAISGIITETGELLELFRDYLLDNVPLDSVDRVGITEELGDMMWYIALAANALHRYHLKPGTHTDSHLLESWFTEASHLPLGCQDTARSLLLELAILATRDLEDMRKRALIYNKWPNLDTLEATLVMVLSCVNSLSKCFEHDVSLELICTRNIAKLNERYGEAYSDYLALHRNLPGERAVLEGLKEEVQPPK